MASDRPTGSTSEVGRLDLEIGQRGPWNMGLGEAGPRGKRKTWTLRREELWRLAQAPCSRQTWAGIPAPGVYGSCIRHPVFCTYYLHRSTRWVSPDCTLSGSPAPGSARLGRVGGRC